MVTCLAVMGCESVPDPRVDLPRPVQVGDHLRFHTDEDGEGMMCAGSLGYMDRYIGELMRIHDATPNLVVDYYWFPLDEGRISEICPNSTACGFSDGTVVTPLLPHEHELVHAVRADFGFSQDFLEEGAAELWGGYSDRGFDYSLDVERGIDLAAENLPIEYYGVAGRFAAFVGLHFGMDAFIEIGEMTRPRTGRTEVEQAFVSVVGVTVEDVVKDYEAASWSCGRSLYRDDSVSCAAARQLGCDAAESDGTLVVSLDVDCASEDFVGPRDGMMWSEFLLDVSSDRGVVLSASVDGGDSGDFGFDDLGLLSVRPCGVGCEGSDGVWPIVPELEYELALASGGHLVRVEVPADGRRRGTLTLTIRNACEPRS